MLVFGGRLVSFGGNLCCVFAAGSRNRKWKCRMSVKKFRQEGQTVRRDYGQTVSAATSRSVNTVVVWDRSLLHLHRQIMRTCSTSADRGSMCRLESRDKVLKGREARPAALS